MFGIEKLKIQLESLVGQFNYLKNNRIEVLEKKVEELKLNLWSIKNPCKYQSEIGKCNKTYIITDVYAAVSETYSFVYNNMITFLDKEDNKTYNMTESEFDKWLNKSKDV